MSLVLDTPTELTNRASTGDLETIIRSVYKQVLGNPHVMDSERLLNAESQFCSGAIAVRDFVRAVAKSDFYRRRYFESCAPYRFVELNFKHLLGRAPANQAELSEHIQRCVNEGYDAEIDSYLDSEEYQQTFGDNLVPYYRGATTQVGQKQAGYNNTFALYQGFAGVDSAFKSSRLVEALGTNQAKKISLPSTGGRLSGYQDATAKVFKIVASGFKFDSPRRISTSTYIVPGDRMTPQIQRIQRSGGRIVSITEVD